MNTKKQTIWTKDFILVCLVVHAVCFSFVFVEIGEFLDQKTTGLTTDGRVIGFAS